MTDYRRNSLLEKKVIINPTFGLPLFQGKTTTDNTSTYRLESAPVSIALANDTRKLSHTILTADKKRLAEMHKLFTT